MYHVSTWGIDERMVNVHYYYYATLGGGGGGLQSPTKWCEKVETETFKLYGSCTGCEQLIKSPVP